MKVVKSDSGQEFLLVVIRQERFEDHLGFVKPPTVEEIRERGMHALRLNQHMHDGRTMMPAWVGETHAFISKCQSCALRAAHLQPFRHCAVLLVCG